MRKLALLIAVKTKLSKKDKLRLAVAICKIVNNGNN
jgi:hypothetical protein